MERVSKPDTAVTALNVARSNDFPNIERSFSTLRRLQTYLRCNMKPDRLSGMEMMALHHDRAGRIDEDNVVDELSLNLA